MTKNLRISCHLSHELKKQTWVFDHKVLHTIFSEKYSYTSSYKNPSNRCMGVLGNTVIEDFQVEVSMCSRTNDEKGGE